jgi:CRP-like cAMP-binding protein
VSGTLEVQRRGIAIVQITEPGAVIGELGMLLEQPASADVVAVGEAVVHRIDDGEQLISEYPEFMSFLARMLARRLWQVSTYLSDIQEQFAGSSTTMGLVPTVLKELLDSSASSLDVGSEREPDSPY